MPLKEYSKDYVQNNARNWLKIQQDIAFVEKSLKGSGTPRREIMKSLLERKTSVENDKRQLDLKLLRWLHRVIIYDVARASIMF